METKNLKVFIPPREGDFSRWCSGNKEYSLEYISELYFIVKGSPMGSVYIKEPTININDKIWKVCEYLVESPEYSLKTFEMALMEIHKVFQYPNWISYAKERSTK